MPKLLKVRGSTPAHLIMGRSGIQPPRPDISVPPPPDPPESVLLDVFNGGSFAQFNVLDGAGFVALEVLE